MAPYVMPKYLLPLSIVGTVIGGSALLKDYLAGRRCPSKERLAAKTAIVTGANTGIGKETAKGLAHRGAKVILACRNLEKCDKAQAEIILETANRNVHCRKLDLGSIASIRAFAESIIESESHIDILINNAGVMRCPKTLTVDGFEQQLGVNFLGHFLLTGLLSDKLRKSAPSRIVNLCHLSHRAAELNFDDLNSAKYYNPSSAYNQSQLAIAISTVELANRLKGTGVTVNAVYPGLAKTEINRHLSIHKSYFSSFFLAPFFWLIMKTPVQGAQTSLYCATDTSLKAVSGRYFSNCEEIEIASCASETAKRLWAISEKWTRIT